MRLTLRTLLAWLDDTLSPSEVREIGQHVAESPFASELVARIRRVTRQRRLTVPPKAGADAVDENLVACYLDNELDPEQVADLEKKYLTSDVLLAEVASVHQILSLIGQKAKVPAEARHRMYHLIKGREAVKTRTPRASRQREPEPVSVPVQPWVSPPVPSRPMIERFGPAGLVLVLIIVLCWSAWSTLTPPLEDSSRRSMPLAGNRQRGTADNARKSAREAAVATKSTAVQAEPAADTVAGAGGLNKDAGSSGSSLTPTTPPAATPTTADLAVNTTNRPADADAAKGEKKAATDVPPGSVGLARKPAGLLLRYNPEVRVRDWERLTEATPLREQDRLLSLAPFRASVEIGTADVDLVGETEIWARAARPTQAARLSLTHGRVVLHGTTPSLPFEVQHGASTLTITHPPGSVVGVERVSRRAPGAATASAPVLKVVASDGPVKVVSGDRSETLEGPGEVTVETDGKFTGKIARAAPSWVTETEPTPFDQKVGEQFLKFFRSDRPIVSSLVEASEDDQRDVSRLAISALRAVGDISYIVPLLSKHGDPSAPTARRAAIAVLRVYLDEGPEAARALRAQLKSDLGDATAATVEKLLVGYTEKEAADPATHAKLVKLLATTEETDVGVRELALDNLMRLTGRDDLDYDPEKPEGKGLKAWQDLQKEGDLRPAASKSER